MSEELERSVALNLDYTLVIGIGTTIKVFDIITMKLIETFEDRESASY
jgi:hypothetical protein